MKTKMDKKKVQMDYANTINTDALISDFEFMYRMMRMNMALDIDAIVPNTANKHKN